MHLAQNLPRVDFGEPGGEFSLSEFVRPSSLADKTVAPAMVALGLCASLAFLPLVAAQGAAIRRRVPLLPPARPPHQGLVPGKGSPIRVLAIGELTVAGVGLNRGDETVAATTARNLASRIGRAVEWRAVGLAGATANDGLRHLVPRIGDEAADLLIVAFSVNDVIRYRSPAAFATDLQALVIAARARVGNAAVVIGSIAPIFSFPALSWPLSAILGWRSAALQLAANRLEEELPRIVVERFSGPCGRICSQATASPECSRMHCGARKSPRWRYHC